MQEAFLDTQVVTDDELVFDDPLRPTLMRRERAPQQIVREGDVLAGKYRVERVPGRAGLGVVATVRHLELGQEVTLKFLIPDACAYPEFVQRFIREARAAVRIGGEHVARVTDVGRLDSGAPYMVREYLRGPDLAEVLKVRGPLPIAEAVDYVIQACEGVAEGHALGIIHRNLRPTTLVVCRRSDGTPLVKVFDFAAAETLHVDPFTERSVSLVGTSAIMSSLPYLSPEQIRDPHDVDVRADVYSLGTILHELLTGSPVYRGDNAPALLAAVAADVAPSIRELRGDVPGELDHAVLRCLAKNRAIRYSSMGELVTALAPFASAESRGSVERVLRLARQSTPPRAAAPSSPGQRGPTSTLLMPKQAPVTRTQPLILLQDDVTVMQPITSYEPLAEERSIRRTPAPAPVLPAEAAVEERAVPRTPQPPSLQQAPVVRRSNPPALPGMATQAAVAPPSASARHDGVHNAAAYAAPHRAPAPSQTAETMMPPPRSSMPGGLSRSWIPEVDDTVVAKARTKRLVGVGLIASCATLAVIAAIGFSRVPARRAPVAAAKALPAPVAPPPAPPVVAPAPEPAPSAVASASAAASAAPAPGAAVVAAPAPVAAPAQVAAAPAVAAPAPVRVGPPAAAPRPAPVQRASAPARKEPAATRPAVAKVTQAPDLFDSPD